MSILGIAYFCFCYFRAKGLQSIVQLVGGKDLFDYWSDTYKVHTLDWDREKAAQILKDWQAKFSEEIQRLVADVHNEKTHNPENKYTEKIYLIKILSYFR